MNGWPTQEDAERAEQERLERERALGRRLELQAAVRALGKTREGREFLRWALGELGTFAQEIPGDMASTGWLAGRRAFGLQLLGLCVAEDLAAAVMTKENIKDGQ